MSEVWRIDEAAIDVDLDMSVAIEQSTKGINITGVSDSPAASASTAEDFGGDLNMSSDSMKDCIKEFEASAAADYQGDPEKAVLRLKGGLNVTQFTLRDNDQVHREKIKIFWTGTEVDSSEDSSDVDALGSICWKQSGQDSLAGCSDNRLPLAKVTDVYLGKTTPVFDHALEPQDERCCSLLSSSLSLDLEAESEDDLQLLILAINHIVERGGKNIVVDEDTKQEVAINTAIEELDKKPEDVTKKSEAKTEAEDVWKALNSNAQLMSLAHSVAASSRMSTSRLSLVNFLQQKQAKVDQLDKKCEKLFAKLDAAPKVVLQPLADDIPSLYSASRNKAASVAITKCFDREAPVSSEELALLRHDVCKMLDEARTDLEKTCTEVMTVTKGALERASSVEARLNREKMRKRKLLNKIIDLQGSIRVFCRVRPFNARELAKRDKGCIEFPVDDEDCLTITEVTEDGKPNGKPKRLEFDRVFNQTSTQEQVFEDVSPLVHSCVQGFTVCVFAYGQTGTGKTFTMEGNEEFRGVNYRALEEMFQMIKEEKTDSKGKINYSVTISVVEIYNEQARDLLNDHKEKQKVDIREGKEGVYIPGLTELPCTGVDQAMDIMQNLAYKNRSVRGTSMNEHSSRSHCLVFANCIGVDEKTGAKTHGKLILIDLAGSERVKKSEATGQGMKEAQAINKSLSALGNVISSLQNKSSHIPFRDSKLTFLLQNSLGGSCKCLMFCQLSPACDNWQESMCSLTFATRARATKLGQARKNVTMEKQQSSTVQKQEKATRRRSSEKRELQQKFDAERAKLKKALAEKQSTIRQKIADESERETQLQKLLKTVRNLEQELSMQKENEEFLKEKLRQQEKVIKEQQEANLASVTKLVENEHIDTNIPKKQDDELDDDALLASLLASGSPQKDWASQSVDELLGDTSTKTRSRYSSKAKGKENKPGTQNSRRERPVSDLFSPTKSSLSKAAPRKRKLGSKDADIEKSVGKRYRSSTVVQPRMTRTARLRAQHKAAAAK